MNSGERPIVTAKGKQPKYRGLVPTPPPPFSCAFDRISNTAHCNPQCPPVQRGHSVCSAVIKSDTLRHTLVLGMTLLELTGDHPDAAVVGSAQAGIGDPRVVRTWAALKAPRTARWGAVHGDCSAFRTPKGARGANPPPPPPPPPFPRGATGVPTHPNVPTYRRLIRRNQSLGRQRHVGRMTPFQS